MSETTVNNPLIEDDPRDTMEIVGDVLVFMSVAMSSLDTQSGLSPTVASGMSHILKCCAKALKGGASTEQGGEA